VEIHIAMRYNLDMLTVIMECRDQESELVQTLSGLVSGAVEGLISDVVVLDHGSSDGSARVADAAGCKFLGSWDLPSVVHNVRGEWLLVMEPGARLQQGWIEEVMEYVALKKEPARFSLSRHYQRPFLIRMLKAPPPLEHGVLLAKRQALKAARNGMDLATLVGGLKSIRLNSQVIPARAMRATR
jgi:hypothetical protein